jgi:hypothetical protein
MGAHRSSRRIPLNEDAARWETLFERTVQEGKFLYAVTFFITFGVKE